MKRNESKALARAKRMYERLKDVPLIKKANGKWLKANIEAERKLLGFY